MKVDDILEQAVERCAEEKGAHLIELVVRGEKGNRILQVFLDSVSGVTIDQCSAISRAVSETIARANLVPGSYRLEVSSPGADRPLKYAWQYTKHVGRPFHVKRRTEGGSSSLAGTLSAADEGGITLHEEKSGESVSIPFEDIVEARVVTPW